VDRTGTGSRAQGGHDSDREAYVLKAPFVKGCRTSVMIRWTCQNIRQSLPKKSNTIKAPEAVSTFVKTN